MALLAALAGGAGGEAGRQAWTGLVSLVRRPFRRDGDAQDPAVSPGEAELAHLAQAPDDTARAQALSSALAARAALDTGFRASLLRWHERAESLRTGDVHNEISGGHFAGPVLQGRDFSGLSFTTPPAPQADPDTDTSARPD